MYPRRRKRTTWMSILLPAAIEIPRVRNGLALVLAAAMLAPDTVQAQEDNTGNSLPTLSIASVTVGEDAGSVSVTVTLSASSADAVTVAYSGIDGTATEADGDYSLTDGTLTISAGATTGSVPVTIRDDYLDENNETFKIQLSSPTNAEFAGDNSTIESIVTITDDDTRGVSVWPTSLEIDESRDGYYSGLADFRADRDGDGDTVGTRRFGRDGVGRADVHDRELGHGAGGDREHGR